MKKTIEKIVNTWYQSVNNDIDFIVELEDVLPQYKFTFDGDKWIIVSEL
jgi:hypothetical protein